MSEFNHHGDAFSAARVFALTSLLPNATLPPSRLPSYPRGLSKQLKLTLFPLDITNRHCITRGEFRKTITPLLEKGSPLAEWVNAFMTFCFRTVESQWEGQDGDKAELGLHDPVCAYYVLTQNHPAWKCTGGKQMDIRVDATGQWTRGMSVVDRRGRIQIDADYEEERPDDQGLWLNARAGNRVWKMEESPVGKQLGEVILRQVFG